jgi:PTH1 family peptidyl-tRNA hydrolase
VKLIIGLGNPGIVYADSRHNIGFSVIKALSKRYKVSLKKDNNAFALSGKGRIEGKAAVLALPLTFMNLSGIAVGTLIKKYEIDLEDLLIVCDDLDLGLGVIKIRPSGSSGGHRGLGSIIASLGTECFPRLRIGIGRPLDKNADTADFVLAHFLKKEKAQVVETVGQACDCCRVWATEGLTDSMNTFNRRSK